MPSVVRPARAAFSWFVLTLLLAAPALALQPDEIALVVNAKVPEGRKLAELYAATRHMPDGRIIELEIDPVSTISPVEEIPFSDYEPQVVDPIRRFLVSRNLAGKIKCLVTFWGVPLRIGNRVLSAADREELNKLKQELNEAKAEIGRQVAELERSASRISPSFSAATGEDPAQLLARMRAAITVIMQALPAVQDPSARNAQFLAAISATERLVGSARTKEGMSDPLVERVSPRPPSHRDIDAAQAELASVTGQIAQLQTSDPTPDGRLKARELARSALGTLGYADILEAQVNSFQTEQTGSALDNELALLWWRGYPRARWMENPLYWRVQAIIRQRRIQVAPVVMVTRLDGPSIEIVRNLIETPARVEKDGLKGIVALDARGKPSSDAYGRYDQTIRNLAALLKAKTKLDVTLENTEALIPPHSMKNVALYCGWYSLRNYVPPGTFADGAVGFHVASLEMVSLRARGEHGWVHGLLSDGVVATLGPVAEPYLQSFPAADEFFPLLLTGKLTLAEAYWRTLPLASWMQGCIGDPLYNPYQENPPLPVTDLPTELRPALQSPVTMQFRTATAPSTQPAPIAR